MSTTSGVAPATSPANHVGAFALYALLAVALTWPLATHLDTFVADRGDPLLNCWIIDWGGYALTHQPLHLFDAPILHPAKLPLAFSENMTGIDLAVLPFHLAGASPLAVYNLAMILGFAFSGYGAWVLARMITGNFIAAFACGIFAAFVSFKFDHLSHVQVVWTGWLPLMLAALLAYWRHADTKHALLLGTAFVMNGLTNIYWLAFGATAIGITIVFLFIVTDRHDAQFWRRLIVTLVISCAVLLPFLIPYEIVSKTYRMWRRSYESLAGSATPYDFLMASERSLLYGKIAAGRAHEERHLFLGVMPVLLALFSVWRRRLGGAVCAEPLRRVGGATKNRILDVAIGGLAIAAIIMARTRHGADVPITLAVILAVIRFAPNIRAFVSGSRFSVEEWAAALWIAIGFAGALGEHAFLHPFLFRLLPIFRATRTPSRWVVILQTGLAVWMAIGFVELLARVRMRRAVATLVLALTIVEILPRIAWADVPARPAPVYDWIAQHRPAVFIELPVSSGEIEAGYLLAATHHHVRMMNGVSGFDPPLRKILVARCEAGAYDDAFYDILRGNGCRVVVVHNALLGDKAGVVHAWIAREHLAPVATFGDDEVYDLVTSD
ncbi:MAG TPA: hypothetical protein VGJ81_22975 [Thermoanaerobaculia bacterium]